MQAFQQHKKAQQLLLSPANAQKQCHSPHAVSSLGAPLTQRLLCVSSISHSPNESSVLKKKEKKTKKQMALWSVLIALAEPRVCSLRCGMKSQRKPKECELSFCRLPTAAVAHRTFIAWQQGKPPYHNTVEMRRKREQTKAALFTGQS